MKRFFTFFLALLFAVTPINMSFSSVFAAGFTMEKDSKTAVEKNKAAFLDALKNAKITTDFSKENLEDMIAESCTHSADKMIGCGYMVEKFKIVSPTSSKAGYMSAIVLIYQDDAEEMFEVKKEITNDSSSSGDINIDYGDNTEDILDKYTDAQISAMKKSIAAAKTAIYDAFKDFEVSNDTPAKDVLNMAKSALPSGSNVEVSLDNAAFKVTKATTTVEGLLSASLTLKCEAVEDYIPLGKTIPLIATQDSVKINEDRSAIGQALDALAYTNKMTKEIMFDAALSAVKNGTSIKWKDNFAKKNATFLEDGYIIGYLEMSLGEETRETRIHRVLPKLVRKLPPELSVTQDEWEILIRSNVERSKFKCTLLSAVAPLQEACNIREKELVKVFSHTRPDGTGFQTSISPDFKYKGVGENLHLCATNHATPEDAMNGWMNSPGHRANILRDSFDYIGVGSNSGGSVQIFAMWNNPIVSVTTCSGKMNYEDEDDMQKDYAICTTSDGLVSYLPIDINSMTKIDGGYQMNLRCETPVIFTIGNGKNNSGNVSQNGNNDSQNTSSPKFTDVASDAYYANAVAWAVEKKITSGTSDTQFSPDINCTRAQILTFLWRAVGSPKATVNNPFTDVKSTDYYYDAAIWAYEKGMVEKGEFNADTPCTRSSTVTYLWKNAGSPSASKKSSFKDVSSGADYAKAVSWAVKSNITSGISATEFGPDNICSRGQIVTFLNRALGN